ncbi:MAG: DNA polymerase ligase N-terminal domain-containing protein [Guyparkeria sp.]
MLNALTPASGGEMAKADSDDGTRFVIQWHDATQRHFDVRLEVNGVLKSWAVPKGPSTDPSEKRLAIEVGEHALDYADFEGAIPEGEYGAGTVMVWDRGTYRNLDDKQSVAGGLGQGLVEVWLDGEKIRGGYAFKRIQGGEKPQWLLIKMRDEAADARRNPVSTQDRSVRTGRTLAQIRDAEASA